MNYLIETGQINNQQSFGESLGYNNKSSFSQLLKSNNVSDTFLSKIKIVYPEFEDWLLNNEEFIIEKNVISGTNHRINQGGIYNENSKYGELWDIIRKKDEQIAQKDEQINKLIEILSRK